MQQAVIIDSVLPQKNMLPEADVFEIEWFETQKHKFSRQTKTGVLLQLINTNKKEWNHADALYNNGKLVAQIFIKPALTISFVSNQANEVADFCYYIGNRHLPVFTEPEAHLFYVPYDGNLYEQVVAKFADKITLSERQLFTQNLLKAKK
ncbi:urease accessory protein UreE [Flavobacterium agricola]|uniref:Urease accessory protein UreE n=2 Tax=Flavobacterium agricola TaxID=2870839 RepID=A0ABY6M4K9_9FLAO|nr:urease accessory protein UreE [Flavobacterium agricola]